MYNGLQLPVCFLKSTTGLKGHPQLSQVQKIFLRRHDRKTKRLWFLWKPKSSPPNPVSSAPSKCGCVGGCAFFGSNSGGPRFFCPSRKDWLQGLNVAHFRVNGPDQDPGFGQSILNPSVLVFDTPPYTTHTQSLLELPSEWRRDAPFPKSVKTPLTFKPSLLADLSHTESGGRIRRLSTPMLLLQRQARIGTETEECIGRRGSTTSTVSSDSTLSAAAESQPVRRGRQGEGQEDEFYPDDIVLHRNKWMSSALSLDSLSDVSFTSALSVQEECMVNLQMHLNKPITGMWLFVSSTLNSHLA